MKIDFISTGYYPIIGGTETVVKNLAERMALKGHNVTVHASTYNPNYNGKLMRREVINGVNVIRYKLLPFYIFLPKIRNPEIIHLFPMATILLFRHYCIIQENSSVRLSGKK